MAGPFIFIATNRLKSGALEAESRRVPELCRFIEANEPRMLSFNEYADDDGIEVSVVQVHADAESMELHMGVVREWAERAYAETLEATTSIQVYGMPSAGVLDMLSRQAGNGPSLTVRRHHLGGFTRVTTA
jgi:hypothetical protein